MRLRAARAPRGAASGDPPRRSFGLLRLHEKPVGFNAELRYALVGDLRLRHERADVLRVAAYKLARLVEPPRIALVHGTRFLADFSAQAPQILHGVRDAAHHFRAHFLHVRIRDVGKFRVGLFRVKFAYPQNEVVRAQQRSQNHEPRAYKSGVFNFHIPDSIRTPPKRKNTFDTFDFCNENAFAGTRGFAEAGEP